MPFVPKSKRKKRKRSRGSPADMLHDFLVRRRGEIRETADRAARMARIKATEARRKAREAAEKAKARAKAKAEAKAKADKKKKGKPKISDPMDDQSMKAKTAV